MVLIGPTTILGARQTQRDLKGQQTIKVLTYRLFEGKYDPVSGFGELMDSVPDPLEARKSFLLENRRHKFVSAETRQMN